MGKLSGGGSIKSINRNNGNKKLFNLRKDEPLSERSHKSSVTKNPRVNAFNPGKKS
jgi:hypothetical protein